MVRTAKTVSVTTNRVKPVAAFGRLLQAFRGGRSVEQVLMLLRAPALAIDTNQGTVSGYEQGYNRKPDPVVLWGLAKAYGISLDGLIAVLHANRTDPQLSLDAARRVVREHSHGPTPEVAAAAIEIAETRLFNAAADLERIRAGLRPSADEAPPHPRR